MADALVIIDMQAGSFGPACPPRHDLAGLCQRLNGLAAWVRTQGGRVIWVQHDGPPGDELEPGSAGWQIMPELRRSAADTAVRKTACDSFLGTSLEPLLRALAPQRVIITGWATDFCVDTTVRACTGRGFRTVVPADGHTLSDRPHLPASSVIAHHNYLWANLLAPGGPASVLPCAALMAAD
jgi:nicotinamidase-related amidase